MGAIKATVVHLPPHSGFDNDPADVFERQIDFIRRSAILAKVGLLNAVPDTQLWRRLEREERLLGEAP